MGCSHLFNEDLERSESALNMVSGAIVISWRALAVGAVSHCVQLSGSRTTTMRLSCASAGSLGSGLCMRHIKG